MISQSGMVVWGEEGLGCDWVGLGWAGFTYLYGMCGGVIFEEPRII